MERRKFIWKKKIFMEESLFYNDEKNMEPISSSS